MLTTELLRVERIVFNHTGGSKKRLLEFCSRFLAQSFPECNLAVDEIFEALYAREYIGTTAIGNGVAMPHCKSKNCKFPIGVLFKLKDKIDFDAYDKKPVSIIFFILLPETYSEKKVQMLRKLKNVLQLQSLIDAINAASSAEDIFLIVQDYLLDEEEAFIDRETKQLEAITKDI